MKIVNIVALTLLIVGGLNWGLYGLFAFDLVAALTGAQTWLANIIYVLIGTAAVYSVILLRPLSHIETPHGHHFVSR